LELYVVEEKPDLICITESWTNETIVDAEINFTGYTLFRKDRKNRVGGGVLLYVRNNIKAVHRTDLENEVCEMLWCELHDGKERTLIGVCYRSPSCNVHEDNELFKMLGNVKDRNAIVVGDFNFGEIDWIGQVATGQSQVFLDSVNDNFLHQHVEHETRGQNILDLVLSTEENMVQNLEVGEPFGNSDHRIIRWKLVLNKEIDEGKEMHNYFKADYDKIRKEAEGINWMDLIGEDSINKDWENVKATLDKLKMDYIPIRRQNRNKCKWANRETTKCRRAKEKAWKKYRMLKDDATYEKYKNKLSAANKSNKEAQKDFEKRLAKNIKNDSKSFFAYIRSKQRTKDKVGPLRHQDGALVIDDQDGADLLNKYFSSVFTQEDLTNVPEPKIMFQGRSEQKLTELRVSTKEVLIKLEKLKVDKSPGGDNIHPKLLFELKLVLAEPIAKLFNKSLSTGEVPTDWKDATITALFKKGNRSEPGNYRPVSLTSILCKILESIIKDKIVEHLQVFNLINDSQHGFMKGRSCLTNLLEYLETVTKLLDEGVPVDVIYLDFAKAFDKVPHARLLKKLEAHGIGGHFTRWIKNWLGGRRQRVNINGKLSGWANVMSGVPQGSVLGPLLFLIFINDIDDGIMSKIWKFADDSKICSSVVDETDAELVQKDLKNLFNWSEDWQMLFNIDKCIVLHMGCKNQMHRYELGGKELKSVEQERDLGIIIHQNGKSAAQCTIAANKANQVLGMIRRNIKWKNQEVIVRLYKALVRPKIEYCVQAWSPNLEKDKLLLEKVQRRATKMIEGFGRLSYDERLRRTGLTTLEERRIRGDLIETFKMVKGISKVDHTKFFSISEHNRTRGNTYKLEKKQCNTNIRSSFFSQRIVNYWNGLPEEVVSAESVNTFKNRLDKWKAG
jgi:ribonuclease P/MRP protein subunit RPP40